MFTARWAPVFTEWDQLQKRINRLFEPWNGGVSWLNLAATFPAINIWEEGDNVYAEAELPGLKQEKIEIYVTDGDQLTLQGERTPETPEGGLWHRQERGFGKFARTLTLPCSVNADKVEARFENGVLHVVLPKAPEAKPRKIEVKTV
jgi:HSP20 family protein